MKGHYFTYFGGPGIADNNSNGFPVGPLFGPLASDKGSQLWAPVLQVVYDGGIPVQGPIPGAIRFTLEQCGR